MWLIWLISNVMTKNHVCLVCRCYPRGPTCQESAQPTGEATEVGTPEEEAGDSVPPDLPVAHEDGSDTSWPGLNIKRPTPTTEASQWRRDSGGRWTILNRCPNVTRVSFSSHHHRMSWEKDPAGNHTLNNVNSTLPDGWSDSTFNLFFFSITHWSVYVYTKRMDRTTFTSTTL